MAPIRSLAFLIGCALAAACGSANGSPQDRPAPGEMQAEVHKALAAAESATLYALHPYPHETEGEEWAEHARLDDYVVLDQAEVDAATARKVLTLVYDGIEASDGRVAACFNPRHGIRVSGPSGDYDLVICYECLSMQIHHDGEFVQNLLTAEATEKALTPIWAEAGLELHR